MWWLTLPVLIYSAGLIILWLILIRREEAVVPDVTSPARVSVIVAARNEENQITKLLGSLVIQDYPDNLLEIIIVNDNSTDRTPIAVSEFISSLSNKSGPRMRLIYNPFSGKKRAIRYGIEKAAGEIIVTTDADCIVGSGWVRSHASWYRARLSVSDAGYKGSPPENAPAGDYQLPLTDRAVDADMVLASVFQKPAGGFWSQFGAFEFSALQAITEAAALAGHPVMCNAANMSFRRDVYLRHAGELREDLPSGDDMFLLEAVMRGGGAATHDGRSAAAVKTAGAVTAVALLRQRARWASKALHLRGTSVIALATATAACNAALTAAAMAACFSVAYLPVVAAMYGIKAVPDYLLIAREMKKRGNRMRVMHYIVSELVYPFYFIAVWMMSLFPPSRKFKR
ncbi:MAG: glycosyltransferase [Bacteroidales bacterium]|jgi:cellulose synthase/poly-beta-1,6-N-acetylglucosamine synthase-like glycosyltransferase|nr:glycosyltransferase [Bacteroidales bacterium]